MHHTLTLPSGEQLSYHLERRQRRTVGLKITSSGLIIHAPKRISQQQLERLLLQKYDWISKKLTAMSAKQVPAVEWQDGAELLFLGTPLTLAIKHDVRSRTPSYEPGLLQLAMPNHQEPKAIARKVVQWYGKQAITDFARRLELFATRLGVDTPTLFLSNARTRWGSCNSKQEIRLSWRLLQAPPHIINYVICHELAHLKEMNHSAKFWAVVASIYPDYKAAEKDLKTWSPQLHRI